MAEDIKTTDQAADSYFDDCGAILDGRAQQELRPRRMSDICLWPLLSVLEQIPLY